eukprot:7375310-Prymnesium_polylepis.1
MIVLAYAPYTSSRHSLETAASRGCREADAVETSTNLMSSCSASSHLRGEAMLRPPNHRDDRLNWCSAL